MDYVILRLADVGESQDGMGCMDEVTKRFLLLFWSIQNSPDSLRLTQVSSVRSH